MPDALIKLKDVGIKREGRWLVHDINFSLNRGEILTLIGPNGSGKSTTAKLALKIIKPSCGNVWQAPNLKIGYVPQKLNFDYSLPITVYRFMTLTHRLSSKLIDEALSEVGGLCLKNSMMLTLSGGELQRVMLARAAALKPDILVLDEPLQGVDFSSEADLYKLIAHYRDKLGCAILLISHDLHIVMAASDEVLCLNGHICCRGKPKDILKDPKYNSFFPQDNQHISAFYQHEHDHSHTF